jgi:hypothetical protein
MPPLGDLFLWLVPLLIAGVVSAAGLMGLVLRRFVSKSGLELTGTPAIVLGVLAVPALPVVLYLNPSLAERNARREANRAATEHINALQEQIHASMERRQQIKAELDALEHEKPKNVPADVLAELSPVEAEQRIEQQRHEIRRWTRHRTVLMRENTDLLQHELQLHQEEGEALLRNGARGGEGKMARLVWSVPIAWGSILSGVAWLIVRRKTPAPQERIEPAPAAPPDNPQWTKPDAVPTKSSGVAEQDQP